MSKKKSNLSIMLPTKWGDLTSAQVVRVAKFLNSKSNVTEQLIQLAADFANLYVRENRVTDDGELILQFYHRKLGNVCLDSEQVTEMVKRLDWLTGEISLMQSPDIPGCKAPDYRLYGVTLEQFLTAEAAYHHYVTTKSIEALRMCVAALYPRNNFDANILGREAARLARLDDMLPSVFLWFTSAKKYLSEKYPCIFGSDGNGDAPKGAEILLSMLSSLNGGDVTKNDSLKAGELHEALYELNLKIKNSQKNA